MNQHSEKVYRVMLYKEYPADFSRLIAQELSTEYTANRMIAYFGRAGKPPLEEVADEMLAILADRDKFVDKHINQYAQEVINRMYAARRLEEDEEDIDSGQGGE